MILDSDTNIVYVSKQLLDYSQGIDILGILRENGVSVDFIPTTRDVWARDFMPVQIAEDKYVGYEYCPDYLYPKYTLYITNQARVCDEMMIDTIPSGIILDGGNVVKTSKGIIMIDKVFQENRHLTKIELINRLENAFCSEIIFLPWDRSEHFGHSDGICREILPGKVLLTNYHRYSKKFATQFHQILSSHFDVEVLDYEVAKPHKNNWCYINYLQVSGTIFLPQLSVMRPLNGNKCNIVAEDSLAIEQFQRLLSDCKIIPVACSEIVEDGGALNCVTWNIKKPRPKSLLEI
ncbi:MAG: agmatine deiminase family protein [Barnesiella sp.]|nr:agmatine deiminase family protein [Bacteroidales bacterium]MBD5250796.1 agmatine deiminase family protein [Barnesiella sp.]